MYFDTFEKKTFPRDWCRSPHRDRRFFFNGNVCCHQQGLRILSSTGVPVGISRVSSPRTPSVSWVLLTTVCLRPSQGEDIQEYTMHFLTHDHAWSWSWSCHVGPGPLFHKKWNSGFFFLKKWSVFRPFRHNDGTANHRETEFRTEPFSSVLAVD